MEQVDGVRKRASRERVVGVEGKFVLTALIQSITNHGYSKCQQRHSPTQINTYLDVIKQELSIYLLKVLNLM